STFKCSANEPFVTVFSGLEPDKRYFYHTKYRHQNETDFVSGEEHYFHTQRKKGDTFCFTVEADPHPYDKKGYHPLWETALLNQLKDSADFMLDLGDTFGNDHFPFDITSEEVRRLHLNCRPFFGEVCHSAPLFLCLGNHEGESGYYLLQTPPDNLATWGTIWRNYYYPNPVPGQFYSGNINEERNGIGQPANYYAWQWGNALFVVLDVYRYYKSSAKPRGWEWTIGKEQYNWLKETLENSSATFKFVFAHHVSGETRGGIKPSKYYEWGGYESDGETWGFTGKRPGWEMPVHQLMVKNKVNIFFQGHDHLFAWEQVDGMIYQTVPMPDDSSYQIGISANGHAYTGTSMGGSGHLRVTVSPEQIQVDYILAVLPKDETAIVKNGDVAFSYAINGDQVTTLSEISRKSFNSSLKINPNPLRNSVERHFKLKKRRVK
ncbi:MAG TPA: metallophosphoesterase, partial [Draconibacterium sp.]|nr:metallophosphoesterase [Draconibacterium sp.]